MQKHLFKIAWSCLLLSFVLSILYLQGAKSADSAGLMAIEGLFLAAMSAVAFLTLRIVLFRRKLVRFVNQLLAGNYGAGLPESLHINDETTRVEKLLNKLADQLRTYDKLFAERVSMSHRALELLYRTTDQPVIMADMDKRQFRFNPPAVDIFGVDQKSFSFDAIEKLPANAAFVRQFRRTSEDQKVPVEKTMTLQIPVRNEQRTLRLRLVPLKDFEENVQLVLMFVRPETAADSLPLPPPI